MSYLIWLSHIIDHSTPLYGGSGVLDIRQDRLMTSGDTCNTHTLFLPNHAGTHVDVPYHFISSGKRIEYFAPEAWIFNSPKVIEIPAEPGQLLTLQSLGRSILGDTTTDMVLLRTGFERHRGTDHYWNNNPGIAPETAGHLHELFPSLRAVGVDTISISAARHREQGREAHKAFLSRDLLVFEDMSLRHIRPGARLHTVIAFPLRFEGGDGAPCTIAGHMDTE